MSTDPNEITEKIPIPPTVALPPRRPEVDLDNQSTLVDGPTQATHPGSAPSDGSAETLHWPATLAPNESSEGSSGPTFSSWNGKDFGRYELLGEIGRGGMGVVYKARQKGLDRTVAVKMILGSHLAGPEQVERFYAEARAAARLHDPHVVAIHDVGQIHGQHYFAMEFVDGPSLAEKLHKQKMDPTSAAVLMATVARAVGRLHSKGIIHRDLKPSNILIDANGRPLVTDFGLVKLIEEGGGQGTCSGTILGTPSYMSPEQAGGNPSRVGPAGDIYSLGAILYELLTGRPPFCDPNPMDTLMQVLQREPTPLRELRSDVPSSLEFICLKCLEKAPADRYKTAEDLADDLEKFARGDEVEIRRRGLLLRIRRWARREPAVASRIGGIGLCLIVAEANYRIMRPRTAVLHAKVMGILLLWGASAWLFRAVLRMGKRPDAARLAWAGTDLALLTILLIVDDAMISPLINGYALLVAASGLWFRVPLVWATTAMAVAAYGVLVLEALLRQGFLEKPAHHFMSMVTLCVLGAVIKTLVKRARTMTQAGEPGGSS